MSEPLVPREDVQATLAAQRELGPERDAELADAFLARIDRRLEERLSAKPARGGRRGPDPSLGIVSVIVAIPLIAIAGGTGGAFGILAVCVMLFLLNALYWEHSK